LSIELTRGGQGFLVTGAKVSQAEISLGVDAYMRMALSFIGRDMDVVSATAATFSTTNAFAGPDAVLQWNANQQQVQNMNLRMNNNLDDNRVFLGSRLRNEPVRGGRLEVTGSFETEFLDSTLWTDFVNASQRQLLLTATGDQIGATGRYYGWTLTLPIAVFNTQPVNVSGEGRIVYTADYKAYRSSTQNEATLVIRNSLASISA
jgi:hypothetical protein